MAKSPRKGKGGGDKVGPGNPPKSTRFKKGVSGNPNGRPAGSKNLSTILREAADGTVVATIDGKQRKITRLQAAAVQLATNAAKGDTRSIGKLLDVMDEVERRAAAAKPAQFPLEAADVAVIKHIHTRMKLCSAPTRNPTKR